MRLFTLNEFFSTKSDASSVAEEIMADLKVSDYKLDVKEIMKSGTFVVMVHIKDIDQQEADKIVHEINKNKPDLLKKHIWIDHKVSKDPYFKERKTVSIVIKKIMQGETKPERYVYHFSPKSNRETIQYEGILPKSSEEGKWSNQLQLSYPASVFVSQDVEKGFYNARNYDVWKIDTSLIDNKFYKDVNEPYSDSLMTFKKILPHAVKLYREAGEVQDDMF